MRHPKKPVILGFAWTITAFVAPRILSVWATKQSWWQQIPFDAAALFGAVFVFGVIAQDVASSESWFKSLFRRTRRIYVLENVVKATANTPEKEWNAINAHLRFLRDLSDVSVTVRVNGCINLAHAENTFVLRASTFASVRKDQQEKLTLAILPYKTYNGAPVGYTSWGEKYRESGDVDGMHSFSGGTDNIVEIEIKSGWRYQKERIFITYNDKHDSAADRLFIAWDGTPPCVHVVNA